MDRAKGNKSASGPGKEIARDSEGPGTIRNSETVCRKTTDITLDTAVIKPAAQQFSFVNLLEHKPKEKIQTKQKLTMCFESIRAKGKE